MTIGLGPTCSAASLPSKNYWQYDCLMCQPNPNPRFLESYICLLTEMLNKWFWRIQEKKVNMTLTGCLSARLGIYKPVHLKGMQTGGADVNDGKDRDWAFILIEPILMELLLFSTLLK